MWQFSHVKFSSRVPLLSFLLLEKKETPVLYVKAVEKIIFKLYELKNLINKLLFQLYTQRKKGEKFSGFCANENFMWGWNPLRKKLLQREAPKNFVGSSLEYPRQWFLDQRNQILADDLEVLVDGQVDDFPNHLVASEQVHQVYFALPDRYLDVHLVHDEVSFPVDLLVHAFDSDVTRAACEISRELSASLHRDEKNFAIDGVTAEDVEMRQVDLEGILRGILVDAASSHQRKSVSRRIQAWEILHEIFEDPIGCAISFDVFRIDEQSLSGLAAGYNQIT